MIPGLGWTTGFMHVSCRCATIQPAPRDARGVPPPQPRGGGTTGPASSRAAVQAAAAAPSLVREKRKQPGSGRRRCCVTFAGAWLSDAPFLQHRAPRPAEPRGLLARQKPGWQPGWMHLRGEANERRQGL